MQDSMFRRYRAVVREDRVSLIAPVSMLLAIPYAFRVGARGAIGGVAVGLAVGIAYFRWRDCLKRWAE